MTNELTVIKKKYLKQKKRERLRREQETGEVIYLFPKFIFIDESIIILNKCKR